METLAVRAGAPSLTTFVGRALSIDNTAIARIRVVDEEEGALDVFVSTPFDCVAARRVVGVVSRNGAAVAAADLLAALRSGSAGEPDPAPIGSARDAMWPGALPPVAGFVERDIVPVSVARQLADAGRALARQFSGPAGPPKSLLDSVVLTADAESADPVEIPMRMIFTCTALGLIPGFEAPADIPRHLRVATAGRWVRLDAPFGSVYRNAGLGLLF